MKISLPTLILSVIFFSGCATQSVRYPDYKGVATVAPSAEVISAGSRPAGDYLIPGSQVSVSGSSKASGSAASNMFGLLGAMVAMSVDQANNSSAVGEHAAALKLNFQQELSTLLEKKIQAQNLSDRYKISSVDSAASIKLMPAARMMVVSEGKVRPDFHLSAFFKDASGSEVSKVYTYTEPTSLSFAEWADRNGQPMKDAAQRAFDKMSTVFLKDVGGQFNGPLAAEPKPLVKWRVKNEAESTLLTSVLLQDDKDFLVVTPIAGDKVFDKYIQVLDKTLIQIN